MKIRIRIKTKAGHFGKALEKNLTFFGIFEFHTSVAHTTFFQFPGQFGTGI